MSTVDLTKVAGFKAVDAEGNDLGIVSLQDMTNMVKESIVQEAVAMQSVSTLAETSTLAATDTYEDKLDISDTFSYVRTLDSSGNPKRTSQNALATVVGRLIGTANYEKSGLISATVFTAILRGMGKEIYEITNADDIQHNGIYRFNASTSNEILGEKWGLLIHACPFDGAKSFAQIFISSNNRLIFRQNFDNTVGAWTSVI